MERVNCLVPSGDDIGESPLWSERDRLLYWVDVSACSLHRMNLDTLHVETRRFDRPLGAVAQASHGRLLLAFRSGISLIDGWAGDLCPIARAQGDERFNDGKCDRRGRFWVGTFDRTMKRPIGALYRLDGTGLKQADSGFSLSNGIAWSPGGNEMYFADTHARCIYAYACDSASGELGRRRVFAQFHSELDRPDGCTVDGEGGVWTALAGGSAVVRLDPSGKIVSRLVLPVSRPTSVAFGGKEMSTLFVTSMRERDANGDGDQRLAGSLFAIEETGVRGIPEPEFSDC